MRITPTRRASRHGLVLAAAGAAFIAPHAMAGPEEEVNLTKDHDVIVETLPHGAHGTIVMRQVDGDGDYTLEMIDDDVKVIVNGKEIPARRIERDGSFVVVLGDDGKKVTEFKLAPNMRFGMTSGKHLHEEEDVTVDWTTSDGTPPVMIGITMGEPSEALVYHLGLKGKPAIMIERVIDDLPADRAGLRKFDIIVAIEGDAANPGALREHLLDKDPGDDLELIVLRGGDKERVLVRLASYDAEALAIVVEDDDNQFVVAPNPPQALPGGQLSWRNAAPLLGDVMKNDDVRKALEHAMKGLENNEYADQARKAIEQAMKGIDIDPKNNTFTFHWDGDDHKLLMPGPDALRRFQGGTERLRNFQFSPAPRADGFEKELEERIDHLNERIDRLTRAIERLAEDR